MANSTFLPPGNIADHHHLTTPNYSYPPDLLQDYMVGKSYSSDLFLAGFEGADGNQHPVSEDSISSFAVSASILQTPLTSHDMASSGSSSASASSFDGMPINNHIQTKCKREIKRAQREEGNTVAFRTRTKLDTLDDGYKWRKYGKKMVKSNPNPRNYYKCSSLGCKVKKRVERDREDQSYLLTTYEGVHNHESPSIIFYNEIPFALSHGWSQLQPSQPFS